MRTVIITGANGNLGLAVTQKLLERGYRVIATVINEEGKSDLPADPNLEVEVVNLVDENEVAGFVSRCIEKHRQVDAALLLVGGFAAGNIALASGQDIDWQVSLNFHTAYFVARPLFQHMAGKGYGRLVLIGARPALDPRSGKDLLAYSLAKSMLFKLAEFLNEEAKGTNVTTTVVVPSTIDTPANRRNMPGVNAADWVKPEQLAELLEILVSEKGNPLRETILKVYNNA
jgi:NAD(P)-dependent dehydrogenase (short-subunit alcohol dehydrogenase family)